MVVWRRLRRDRFAMTGLFVITTLFVVSYLAPVLANNKPIAMRWQGRTYFPAVADLFPLRYIMRYPELRTLDYSVLRQDPSFQQIRTPVPYSPYETSLDDKLQPPSSRHWLGTDTLGRDVCSRVLHGARISLQVGLVAVGIALTIGLLLGSIAGYYGGITDILISRLIEVMMCFPFFFLILAVIAFLPPSIFNIMIVIGITRWTGIARYARGEFLRIKKQDFAHAARAIGASDRKIIFRHILPNSLAPILVSATFGIAGAILVEAALSFLGLGVQPPTPSWGGMLSDAREFIEVAWWLALFPGLGIFVTVTAYNVLGEGLRDASDPRQALPDTR
ncbi:MAG: ABC transporter permease [Candidatus Krumholzibacteria bacterium]|nr:ABC transporter permease [Candidatus Krumholzibacteria bacterium]